MSKHHVIKLDMEFWSDVENGKKLFEIRENDRDYRVGDTVEFRAYNHRFQEYMTAYAPMYAEITYITNFRQRENHVVFAIKLKKELNQ